MPLTIGQRLKQAREKRYLTLEKAADETRIRVVFLRALEADDYSALPSAAQGRGFLRNYAGYLDINIDDAVAELQKNAPPPEEVSGPLPQVNLVETDVPPLTVPGEEKPPPSPFWSTWFKRQEKTEDAPGPESVEPQAEETPAMAPAEAAPRDLTGAHPEEPVPTTDAESPQDTQDTDEAKQGLLARLASFFRITFAGRGSQVTPESEEADGPAVEPAPKPTAAAESPQMIYAEIGRKLRERRELISLNIDEVERHTHLRGALIRSLEEGALDKLPSSVQTRGMLASYAAFLDLDADAILLRFADAVQAKHREKYFETPRNKIQTEVATSMPFLRSFIAGDLIFGLVMIAVILALSVWGIGRVLNSQGQPTVEATAPSIVDVLGGTPVPTPSVDTTFVPVNQAPTAGFGGSTLAAPTLGENVNVVIEIFAVERTFLRISVDGVVAYEGRIAPRETQLYQAENQIEILTGNAAALRITYNGRDLGLMGNVGEVVSRVYTVAGIVTPTSTVPPTATATSRVSATPTPTQTNTPTATATAKNTSTP